jgi:hypothetical protein
MEDKLIDFQIFLNDKGLINNHDWDFEKEAKLYIKSKKNKEKKYSENDIFCIKYPTIGMIIKDIGSSPRIEVHGYNFCGSWGFDKKGYILKGITWQDKKGNVISNEDFLSLALTS